MWARSVDLFDAKYTSILGDGDAAAICAYNSQQPYGADAPIENMSASTIWEKECSRVSKRL